MTFDWDAAWRRNRQGRLPLDLWLRLALAGAALGLFFIIIDTLPQLTAWPFIFKTREMVVAGCLTILYGMFWGALAGTVVALLVVPAVFLAPAPEHRARRVFAAIILVAAFVCGLELVRSLVTWSGIIGHFRVSNFRSLVIALVVCCAAAAWVAYRPSIRKEMIEELENASTGKTTRRSMLGLAAGVAAVAAIEAPPLVFRPPPITGARASGPNVLLVTFDVLAAENMSLYGYGRPTTPNIDALARTGATFTNLYSCSTFTTPCISAIISGRYLSTTRIYHLKDKFRGDAVHKTLPPVLRAHGYETAAVFDNPWAHPGHLGLGGVFDVLTPPTAFEDFLSPWASRQSFLEALEYRAADGVYLRERLEMFAPKVFQHIQPTFGPDATFQQAERVLHRISGTPFFLWIHCMAPHWPYQPTSPFLHRFLKGDRMRSNFDYWGISRTFGEGFYPPEHQWMVDEAAARYDEWVAQSDDAFGSFLRRNLDKLDGALVAVSADHGESFKGGFWEHGGSGFRRPVIHVPFVVSQLGQRSERRIGAVADQTSLAPTILELVGIQPPSWMEGRSLKPVLDGRSAAPGLAFSEYLDDNSSFERPRRGTLGVIDGQYQYVFDIATRRGRLYRLAEAHAQKNDLSSAEPETVARLRNSIFAKFPQFAGDRA